MLYEGAFTGKAWVASWLLTAAPCGPVVDFDVTFTTGYAEIDFDPLEWAPDGSCDTDYCGTINGSITDRGTFPVDPDAEVILLDKELQALPPLSLSQFDFYLDGFGYDPVVHFYPPSYSFPDPATKADGGQPYQADRRERDGHPHRASRNDALGSTMTSDACCTISRRSITLEAESRTPCLQRGHRRFPSALRRPPSGRPALLSVEDPMPFFVAGVDLGLRSEAVGFVVPVDSGCVLKPSQRRE